MGGIFEGKTVVVTGGGSGIGRETALQFARCGAMVVLAGRTIARLEETVAAISAEGGEALAVEADMAKADDVERLMKTAVERFGSLHILINNAGLGTVGKPLCDVSNEEFDAVFVVNARGVFLGMKYAIPHIIEAGGGSIVNLSSKAGLRGAPNNFEYTGAKHAVIGMTKSAAIDYGRRGVRINCICPAAHESDMALAFKATFEPDAWDARMAALYPSTGRMGSLAEAAAPILFLCSPAASNIHGIALPIDGGFTAQ